LNFVPSWGGESMRGDVGGIVGLLVVIILVIILLRVVGLF
jgi:hypothetical protein